MATVPPPPPYSPREAARAQRAYQRSLRRPSIVGPILLVAIGVVALLVETGKLDAFHLWDWYVRWWPLWLIGVGLLSLGEWGLDRRQNGGSLYRRSHGGLIALIIMLAVVGYTTRGLHGIHWFGHGWDRDNDDFFPQLLGQAHEADNNMNLAIPAGAAIDIQVPHGDVTLALSGDDQLHVQAHLTVYASNQKDAERSLKALGPQVTVDGKNVTLRAADSSDGRADLIIEIPKGALPAITAGHGDVTVEGLAGDSTVTAQHGDVKFDNVGGSARAHMSKGEFNAHGVKGDLELDGRMDDVSISDVSGRVALDGDFFGDTSLARLAGPVHFHSSRTDVEVAAGISGGLTIDSGDLQLNGARGPARVSTSAKDVECNGIAGELRVEDGDGDISVGAVKPLGDLNLHNRNGEIHLSLPQGAGFQLEATARNGDIDSHFDLPVSGSGEGHSVSGQVGSGGPKVELLADHGDIQITQSEGGFVAPPVPPVPPEPPAPPVPPVPGSKPPRHLHSNRSTTEEPSAPTVVQQ
jgi:DUF4097 and DUF4098 domain-containing protein YvlB